MDTIILLFGKGDQLTAGQMSLRGVTVFIYALVLIRISGRRSFGFKSPVDNIIAMTLGAVLSRAIVGASPFFAVLATCFLIVVIHRLLAWAIAKNPGLRKFLEGEKILVFQSGAFIDENLTRALLSRDDVMTGVREAVSTDNLADVEKIFMEYNGRITIVKKHKSNNPSH